MSYIKSNLLPNERLLYRAHLHWMIFAKPGALVVLGLALVLGVPVLLPPEYLALVFLPALGGIVGGILGLLRAWVTYTTSEFGVTTKRVIAKTGLFRRRTVELQLAQAEAMAIDQSVLGRLLGYGTVTVSGTGGAREVFRQIAAPLSLRRQIQLAGERGAVVAARQA